MSYLLKSLRAVFLGVAFLTIGDQVLRAQGGVEQQRILVINSEGGLMPLVIEMNQSVAQSIKSEIGPQAEVLVEWLDINRFSDPERKRHLADMLRAKYSGQRITGIISVTLAPLQFLEEYCTDLFAEVPKVHMAAPAMAAVVWNEKPRVYGALVDYSMGPLLEFIQRVHPGVDRMVILLGVSPYDRVWEQFLREWKKRYMPSICFEFVTGLSMAEMMARVKRLDDRSVVYTPGIMCDGAGEWMVGSEAAARIAQVSRRPVYSAFGQKIAEHGAVGGIGPDFQKLGPQAVKILASVLEGKTPAPGEHRSESRAYFNWRELSRWKVREEDLPEGSEVMFRPPGFIEHYWPWVLTGALVILVQSGFIAALLVQRQRRRKAEFALAEYRQQLTHLVRVSMLGELTGTLSHEFSHPLAVILANAEAARKLADDPTAAPKVQEMIGHIVEAGGQATELLQQLRGMVRRTASKREVIDLHKLVREVLNLMKSELTVRRITSEVALGGGACRVQVDAVQMRQVLLNAIYNACEALAHCPAGAKRLKIYCSCEENGMARLEIADSGGGVPPAVLEKVFDPFFTTKAAGLGLGMAICRQIVQEHGGRIIAENRDDGFVLTVFLPLA